MTLNNKFNWLKQFLKLKCGYRILPSHRSWQIGARNQSPLLSAGFPANTNQKISDCLVWFLWIRSWWWSLSRCLVNSEYAGCHVPHPEWLLQRLALRALWNAHSGTVGRCPVESKDDDSFFFSKVRSVPRVLGVCGWQHDNRDPLLWLPWLRPLQTRLRLFRFWS